MKLEIKSLSKNYGNKTAVNNISIELENGVYGLLGANGAGKTTLMRMLCGLIKPTSGEILYNEKNIADMGQDYCELLGYLPQGFGYYKDFGAKEFLLYIGAIKGISTKMANNRADELLEIVSLSNERNKKIKTFSGGMRQRLGIAAAMMNDPKILILDEPTAGLDPKERVKFRNLLSSFSKDRILIISTHIVSDIEYIANELVIMKQGQLLAKGEREKIISSINGNVYECIVNASDAGKLIEEYCIGNVRNEGANVYLRIVSDKKPCENATLIEPTLEDLYLYYFNEEIVIDEK